MASYPAAFHNLSPTSQMSTAPHSSRYPADMSLDYSYTYFSGGAESSATYYSPASTSSQSISSDLPDLLYDYDLGTPPSATSSDLLYTPPQEWHPASNPPARTTVNAQSHSPHSWHSTIPGPGHVYGAPDKCDYHPPPGTENIPGGQNDMFDGHQKHKTTMYPHDLLLTQPLSRPPSNTVAPTAPHLNPPTSVNPGLYSQVPLELHQPRPSRRIPIVNLDRLASVCEYNRSNKRGSRAPENCLSSLDSTNTRSRPFQWPTQFRTPSQRSRLHIPQLVHSNAQQPTYHSSSTFQQSEVILCGCGCMESFIFPA
ncbi:hypothetical protein CPB83DRAFT_847896 [Crepidotus variabilis]|uniref:Uncharacterized protein n=1 Tax=Crepidotus variabilis TaxID=179855 RepID=A0A9P6JSD4_9AGAR|nr:hypothetical protein CPB83DRAFT_847896 [Crepidotus variabilis]